MAMGFIEEMLKNKEELLLKLLEILEGKESKAKLNLNDVQFHVGNSVVQMKGNIEVTFVPLSKKK